jgi:hypothetical protein
MLFVENIVTCLTKARITEPEEMAIEREQLGKHISAATYTHSTIEEPWETVFCVGSTPRLHTGI